jgi:hypothetical protein
MNAIEFINHLVSENIINNFIASEAYDEFKRLYGDSCTYGYFRTKFNNTIKNLQESSEFSASESNQKNTEEKLIAPVVKTVAKLELPKSTTRTKKRVIKDYTVDGIPEPPALIPTGTKFDQLISDRYENSEDLQNYEEKHGIPMPLAERSLGGFTRKCADIVAGKPGSGKTTSRLKLAAKAISFHREVFNKELRVGFISAEMREAEFAKELNAYPPLADIKVEYFIDYAGYDNYQELFWEALADNYDLIIVDSFPAVIAHFRMCANEKRSEKEIIFDFINKLVDIIETKNMNVQLINQANKDGNYKGGTELPHMLSSLSFVYVENRKRYFEFEKNRNNGGAIGNRLYFSNGENNHINFDEDAYDLAYNSSKDENRNINDILSKFGEKIAISTSKKEINKFVSTTYTLEDSVIKITDYLKNNNVPLMSEIDFVKLEEILQVEPKVFTPFLLIMKDKVALKQFSLGNYTNLSLFNDELFEPALYSSLKEMYKEKLPKSLFGYEKKLTDLIEEESTVVEDEFSSEI